MVRIGLRYFYCETCMVAALLEKRSILEMLKGKGITKERMETAQLLKPHLKHKYETADSTMSFIDDNEANEQLQGVVSDWLGYCDASSYKPLASKILKL